MEEKNVKEFDIVDGVLKGFNNIYNKTNVTIPEGVIKIGDSAFGNCEKLTSITISKGVTVIGQGAFFHCESLTSIIIPRSVNKIGAGAFWYCASLISIVIPEGVAEISDSTFYYCTNLSNVTIPESIKEIARNAFDGCTSLTSITIPDSVTRIGIGAFSGCSNLVNFNASGNVFNSLNSNRQYKLICNFIREYNTKNTYTEDDINRYKDFIMLTKEKMISELKTEISTFVSETKASRVSLDYTKIEKINEKFDKKTLMPALENKPLIEFMCYNMENAFTLKEISRLIDVAIKTGDTEVKILLLEYKNKHFGDEFIDDLSLDDEDYGFGNSLDDGFGKGK